MNKKQQETQKITLEEMKSKFLKYYRHLPNKSLAANSIGRTLDTINDWEKADSIFSAAVLQAKADFANENVQRIRDRKWILAHTLKDEFADRTEITGANGDSLKIEVLNGKSYTIPKLGTVVTPPTVDTT